MRSAHQAVTWYGPLYDHGPLPDTEDTAGPYTLAAQISARAGLKGPGDEVA